MKKLSITIMAALLLAVFAAPAFAQGSPVDEVLPIEFERPLPAVEEEEEAPVVVAGDQLAATGLELTTGVALAGAMLVVGTGAVFVARRRQQAARR